MTLLLLHRAHNTSFCEYLSAACQVHALQSESAALQQERYAFIRHADVPGKFDGAELCASSANELHRIVCKRHAAGGKVKNDAHHRIHESSTNIKQLKQSIVLPQIQVLKHPSASALVLRFLSTFSALFRTVRKRPCAKENACLTKEGRGGKLQ